MLYHKDLRERMNGSTTPKSSCCGNLITNFMGLSVAFPQRTRTRLPLLMIQPSLLGLYIGHLDLENLDPSNFRTTAVRLLLPRGVFHNI